MTPTIKVRIGETEHTVCMTLSTLRRIEEQLGRSATDIYAEIMRSVPIARDESGQPRLQADGQPVPASPADMEKATLNLRMGFMLDVVASATGLTPAEIEERVGLAIMPVYGEIAKTFLEAMTMLNGRKEFRPAAPYFVAELRDFLAWGRLELGVHPGELAELDLADVRALVDAWGLRQRRLDRAVAKVCWIVARTAGGESAKNLTIGDFMDYPEDSPAMSQEQQDSVINQWVATFGSIADEQKSRSS